MYSSPDLCSSSSALTWGPGKALACLSGTDVVPWVQLVLADGCLTAGEAPKLCFYFLRVDHTVVNLLAACMLVLGNCKEDTSNN